MLFVYTRLHRFCRASYPEPESQGHFVSRSHGSNAPDTPCVLKENSIVISSWPTTKSLQVHLKPRVIIRVSVHYFAGLRELSSEEDNWLGSSSPHYCLSSQHCTPAYCTIGAETNTSKDTTFLLLPLRPLLVRPATLAKCLHRTHDTPLDQLSSSKLRLQALHRLAISRTPADNSCEIGGIPDVDLTRNTYTQPPSRPREHHGANQRNCRLPPRQPTKHVVLWRTDELIRNERSLTTGSNSSTNEQDRGSPRHILGSCQAIPPHDREVLDRSHLSGGCTQNLDTVGRPAGVSIPVQTQ